MNLIESDVLPQGKPYMLRNDGVILECGTIHPYIKYSYDLTSAAGIRDLFNEHSEDLIWFYNNTNSKTIQIQIEQFVYTLLENPSLVEGISIDTIQDIYKQFPNLDKDTIEPIEDKLTLYSVFEELNNNTNQVFCRIRMSNLRWGGTSDEIYFRISSLHFNWFELIWNIIAKFINISNVTIVKDTQTFGGKSEVYKVKGKPIFHMPRDEFLTLEGNPVIEQFHNKLGVIEEAFSSLFQGDNLSEAYAYVHPKYALGYYRNDINTGGLEYDLNYILHPLSTKNLLN